MNDLFSSSSLKRYTDLKHQTPVVDDLEAGDSTANLSRFFEEVEDVKKDLVDLDNLYHRLHDLNEGAKTAYNAGSIRVLRSRMDKDASLVLRRAKTVKGKLQALDRANIAQRDLPGCGAGSSSDRTRMSVVGGLGKKLKELMEDFQSLRSKMSSEYKETVGRRYFTITGQQADEETIEHLISTGESERLVEKAIQEQGEGEVTDVISEIQERHGAAQEMEKSLLDLHQVFLDMAVLVDSQGQQLDDIQTHIAHASSFVRSGNAELQGAKTLQKSSRKCTCIAIALLIVVVIVVVVPISISLT